jgi:hypothetical protein
MPLRDLPTESEAAAALLRTEELRHRRTLRRTRWQGVTLACLAVGTGFSILLPGSSSTGCYLWRATTQPVSGRSSALVLPVAIIALVLADRLYADRFRVRQQVRGWGSVAIALVTGTAWAGLAVQGRSGCSTSPAVIGTVVCGGLAAAIAAHWATRTPDLEPLLPEHSRESSENPLNQSELRETFLWLSSFTAPPKRRPTIIPVLAGAGAALLLLSTTLPWRELIDPVALGPTSEAGLARAQLWDLPYASTWAVLVAVAASVTLGAAVARAVLVLRPAALATGVLVIAGSLAALLRLPPRLSDGVGYRAGLGAWLALSLGVLLLVVGVWLSIRIGPRELAVVVAAGLVGVGVGLFVPAASDPPYRPSVVAGVPHRLLDLQGGQLEDRLGMRVSIGTSDPLDSIAPTLDGTPGQWLLGRTGSEGSTVFEYRDGVALPRVALSHGVTPPALLGVAANRLLLIAGGANGRPFAILSVPLDLVAADISLSHQNSDGSYYVTPGVDVLATGLGPAFTHRNADRSIVIWGAITTWQIPADKLTTGLRLQDFVVAPGPGAPGNAVSTGPDGTTAWRTSKTGLALRRTSGEAQQITGIAPAGCELSSDVASSSLTVDAFAVDVRGNLWLGGSSPTSVVTPDGVHRVMPGHVAAVDSIEARPDGSVLLGVSPGGGDQVLEVTDAAAAASSYSAAPSPTARCDRRKPADGITSYRATVLRQVPAVDPPVTPEGQPGKAVSGTSTQLALDSRGRVARIRVPKAAHVWAPDGQGGLWWTVATRSKPTTETAVHLKGGSASVVRDPAPVAAGQPVESGAAAGDRLITAVGGSGLYNVYGPGQQVKRLRVTGQLRQVGLVQLPSGSAVMVLGERLIGVRPNGHTTTLLGGAASGWPISSAGVPAAQWTTDGQWFAGPDGKLWGYDGSHLARVDGPGKVTLVAGPTQHIPQAADEVTVIGTSLYFELGSDVVRLEPAG